MEATLWTISENEPFNGDSLFEIQWKQKPGKRCSLRPPTLSPSSRPAEDPTSADYGINKSRLIFLHHVLGTFIIQTATITINISAVWWATMEASLYECDILANQC